ncbi:MAG: SAF domain-containing protein [Acidimicrobiales bacterium]
MATTTAPPTRPRRPERPARPAPAVLPPSGRQRRWSLALLAMLLTLGSGLLFAVLYLNAGDRVPVLTLARDVGQGETIARDDLSEIRVSADPTLDLIAAGDLEEVVGQTAAVDLVAGSLLTRGQLGEPAGVQPGQAVVGVRVGTPGVPHSDIRPGMVVDVIFTPEPADKETFPTSARVLARGTIFRVESTTEEGILHVALLLDEDDKNEVATAAHNNQAALALVNSGEIVSAPPPDETDDSTDGSDDDSGEATTTSAP